MLQILGTRCKNIRKTLSCSGDTKKLNLGGLEWDKGKFTTIVTTICKYNCFIHLAYFRLVRYNKVFESKDAMRIQDNWNIFEKGSAEKNCHSSVSDMMKKLYIPLFLY